MTGALSTLNVSALTGKTGVRVQLETRTSETDVRRLTARSVEVPEGAVIDMTAVVGTKDAMARVSIIGSFGVRRRRSGLTVATPGMNS